MEGGDAVRKIPSDVNKTFWIKYEESAIACILLEYAIHPLPIGGRVVLGSGSDSPSYRCSKNTKIAPNCGANSHIKPVWFIYVSMGLSLPTYKNIGAAFSLFASTEFLALVENSR